MHPYERKNPWHEFLKFTKHLWFLGTPLWQIVGFVAICVFVGTGYFHKYEAYASTLSTHELRIDALERNYSIIENHNAKIDQSLDDIKNYLIEPRKH
jgi:hypothetical protein